MLALNGSEHQVTLLFDVQGPEPELPITGPLAVHNGQQLYTKVGAAVGVWCGCGVVPFAVLVLVLVRCGVVCVW